MQQWNLNIQREFAQDWLVTARLRGDARDAHSLLRDFNAAGLHSRPVHRGQRQPAAAALPVFARFSISSR